MELKGEQISLAPLAAVALEGEFVEISSLVRLRTAFRRRDARQQRRSFAPSNRVKTAAEDSERSSGLRTGRPIFGLTGECFRLATIHDSATATARYNRKSRLDTMRARCYENNLGHGDTSPKYQCNPVRLAPS
jgi:hypothetical protein